MLGPSFIVFGESVNIWVIYMKLGVGSEVAFVFQSWGGWVARVRT